MEVNCPAGSREMQCVPLYGWKVVGEGFIEMFFSPPAECHSGFLEEEFAQGVGMLKSAEVGDGLDVLIGIEEKLLCPVEPD